MVKDSRYLVRGRESEVRVHLEFMVRFMIRIVLVPFFLFLSNEGYGVQITTRTPNRVQQDGGLARIDLWLGILMGGCTITRLIGNYGRTIRLRGNNIIY